MTDRKPDKRLPIQLRVCWYSLNRIFRRRIKNIEGMTPDQFTVLRVIDEGGGSLGAQREIVELTGLNANTVVQVLDKIEDKKWIRRKSSKRDKRAREISLTKKGKRTYDSAVPLALELQKSVLSCFTHQERDRFLELLYKLGESILDEESRRECDDHE